MFGQFGSSISEALSTEFFQWFHLGKTGQLLDADGFRYKYQPTSSQFHDLVDVTLMASPAESLRGVQISIRRSFIDDPHHFTMAADISQSFLLAALKSNEAAVMSKALTQIRQYTPASSEMAILPTPTAGGDRTDTSRHLRDEAITRSIDIGLPVYFTTKSFIREGDKMIPYHVPRVPPPLPGEGEPQYLVYTGKRRRLELKLSENLLRMDNLKDEGNERLAILVTSV